MNFNKRLRIAKNNHEWSNGIGTALFLSGILEKDKFIWPYEAQDYLRCLDIIEKPKRHCLIVIKDKYGVNHMGIVYKIEPMRIIHRDGGGGLLKGNVPLDEFLNEYNPGSYIIEYYLPDVDCLC